MHARVIKMDNLFLNSWSAPCKELYNSKGKYQPFPYPKFTDLVLDEDTHEVDMLPKVGPVILLRDATVLPGGQAQL